MYISKQLQQAAIFLAQNRFVPVLEQVTAPLVASVIPNGVACQEPPHHRNDWDRAGSQQEMKMVGHQRPGKIPCFRLFQDESQVL